MSMCIYQGIIGGGINGIATVWNAKTGIISNTLKLQLNSNISNKIPLKLSTEDILNNTNNIYQYNNSKNINSNIIYKYLKILENSVITHAISDRHSGMTAVMSHNGVLIYDSNMSNNNYQKQYL